MREAIKTTLKYHVSWNTEGLREDLEYKLGKIANDMAKEYTISCVVVVIKNCDESSSYDTMDIHVYSDFISANNILNSEMYTGNAIDVYHYRCHGDKFSHVMYKPHDSFSYSRLAGVEVNRMFDDQFVFRMRKVFDMKETTVTLHPMEL